MGAQDLVMNTASNGNPRKKELLKCKKFRLPVPDKRVSAT
jgi:hypothetical protein